MKKVILIFIGFYCNILCQFEVDLAYDKALTLFNAKQYKEAIVEYTKVIQLDPKHYLAYEDRGMCYAFTMQDEKAIEDYTKAIEIHPTWSCYKARGLAYYLLQKYELAYEDLYNAWSLNPTDGETKKIWVVVAEKATDEIKAKWKNINSPIQYEEDYSWFYYSNISFTLSRTNGNSKIKSETFPAMHYTAFQGPQNVNKSNELVSLNTQSYTYMLSMFFPSERLGISFGYEKRNQGKQEIQNAGSGTTLWKGSVSIEDSWYWFKLWYEFIALDLGFGKIGSSLMVQMGAGPESKLNIRSERWDGSKLGTFTDQTYKFKTNLSYLIGAELQYYLPYLPVSIGVGYTLGVKGPIKTDNYELITITPTGSFTEEGSDSINEYGVGAFSGSYFFVNVGIPFN